MPTGIYSTCAAALLVLITHGVLVTGGSSSECTYVRGGVPRRLIQRDPVLSGRLAQVLVTKLVGPGSRGVSSGLFLLRVCGKCLTLLYRIALGKYHYYSHQPVCESPRTVSIVCAKDHRRGNTRCAYTLHAKRKFLGSNTEEHYI